MHIVIVSVFCVFLLCQMLPSEFLNLDTVMERAMVKCIVKPLKEHIYRLFTYDLTRYRINTASV